MLLIVNSTCIEKFFFAVKQVYCIVLLLKVDIFVLSTEFSLLYEYEDLFDLPVGLNNKTNYRHWES